MENYNEPDTLQPEGLFSEFQQTLVPASVGKRLLNFIIDTVAFYIIAFIIAILLALTLQDKYLEYVDHVGEKGIFVFSLLLDIAYFTIAEGFCNGRTLGKLCTGTRVVNQDGSGIDLKKAFLRTLSRLIPFEVISIFFSTRPWHDAWTNTWVIDVKRSANPLDETNY
jgi:uncharacterized RDD family membrane protein YckC